MSETQSCSNRVWPPDERPLHLVAPSTETASSEDAVFYTAAPELPEKWQFDSDVAEFEQIGCERIDDYGTIWHHRARMTDGSVYSVDTSDPFDRRVNVLVGSTPALGTKNDGLYRRLQLNLMRMHYPGVFISTEQSAQKRSLARSAHNLLKLYEHESDAMRAETDKLIMLGMSQGAMKALAACALAPYFGETQDGIKIIYADLNRACFFERLDISRPLETARQYIQQGKDELFSVAHHVRRLPLRALLHYPKTVDLSPRGLHTAAHSLPMLVSGETGQFPPYIPRDAQIYLEAAVHDTMSQPEVAKELFKHHSGVRVWVVDKKQDAHTGGCFGEESHSGFVQRMGELATQIQANTSPTGSVDYSKLDFSNIHHRAPWHRPAL